MKPSRSSFLTALLCMAGIAGSLTRQAEAGASEAPARIELSDQHDKPQVITFPAKQVTIISLADREGREQSNLWAPTLAAYKDRAAIYAIADAKGTPGFMKNSIRRRIEAAQKKPLLIDWSGAVCASIGYQPKAANLVIIAPGGAILHRTSGPPTPGNVKAFTAALERALARAK